MNYSFCIIGKNCASTLDRCLNPLKETGMEIVYTDTGSDDESVAIAEKYTDRIFHFKWCDDFSAARNFAMENCSNDMIFFVDSDEYLLLPSSLKETLNGISLPENAAITRTSNTDTCLSLLKTYPDAIGRMLRINICFGSDDKLMLLDDRVERLFDRRLYHYEGSIHEQVCRRDKDTLTGYEIPMIFLHDGYLGSREERKNKAMRDIRLLLKELDKTPCDPYICFQLGQAYGLLGDKKTSLVYLEKGLALKPDPTLEYVKDMAAATANRLSDSGRAKDALALLEYESSMDSYADYCTALGYAALKCGKHALSVSLYKKALAAPECKLEAASLTLPAHNLGCIYEAYGNKKEALFYFKKAAEAGYENSVIRINASETASVKENEDKRIYHSFLLICSHSDNEKALNATLKSFERSLCGMDHICLGIFNAGSDTALLHDFEKKYPDSVILMESGMSDLNDAVLENEAVSSLSPYFETPHTVIHSGMLLPPELLHP